MKKLLCLFLSILMIFSWSTSTIASSSGTAMELDPTFTNIMDFSANEYFSTSYTRATLTILLALDLSVSENIDVDPGENSYVGKDGISLLCLMHLKYSDDMIIISYVPIAECASYAIIDNTSETIARMTLEDNCKDGMYKNNLLDLYSVSQEIEEALNS